VNPGETVTDPTTLTAVVTGAASRRGIGRATAHALAAAGWNIAVLDLDEAAAKDTADEIGSRHAVRAVGLACDVTDEASVGTAADTLAADAPPVGALVNNAGVTSPIPFLQVDGPEWDRVFAVNVRGAYTITRRLVPGMVERGFGRVVFLSSVSAERGGGVFGGVAYSAAKAAQLGFARALARELGPHGVTVNSVAPGLIDTDITGGALEGGRKDALVAGIPVGRTGRVADVADLITYLCRPETGYVTGATYDVNGGSHIH
jgi:NAD(P)-dependent dehydrogenase (short-subunit alcohol dehydrogenase family)